MFRKIFAILLLLVPLILQAQSKREFRGVWISTVYNIDWPCSDSLSEASQRIELVRLVEKIKNLGFNEVFFQARPCADAFYNSHYESWSKFLCIDSQTPQWDPLATLIEECHKRAMAVHVWINPFRLALNKEHVNHLPNNHLYRRKPELGVWHGGKLYFDPGYPDVREYLCKIVKDIILNYSADGIVFDDYFYPDASFDDSKSFAKYGNGRKLGDYRRSNTESVVHIIADTIRFYRPFMTFGISPSALEDKNLNSFFADINHWISCRYIDFAIPQIYFYIGQADAPFEQLLEKWGSASGGFPLVAGLASYKVDANSKQKEWRSVEQLDNQVDLVRSNEHYGGIALYSAKDLSNTSNGVASEVKQWFRYPALPPEVIREGAEAPMAPREVELLTGTGKRTLSWLQPLSAKGGGVAHKRLYTRSRLSAKESVEQQMDEPMYYMVYAFREGEMVDLSRVGAIVKIFGVSMGEITAGGGRVSVELPEYMHGVYRVCVTAINRLWMESAASEVVRIQL